MMDNKILPLTPVGAILVLKDTSRVLEPPLLTLRCTQPQPDQKVP